MTKLKGSLIWGDGTFSEWSTTTPFGRSHTWTTEGTYIVRYLARCSTHTSISASSDSLVVTITAVAIETIDKPGFVNWQTSQRYPEVNLPVSYRAYGANSSLGHAVEVRFDWADGTPMSYWVPDLTYVSKTWTVVGIYPMTRQVRCAVHPEIVSEWSDPINIIARDPETVSAPNPPTGPDSAIINDLVYFTTSGSESSYSHNAIEYRFIWGDGSDTTAWSTTASQSHRYTTKGDFEVKAQGRCVVYLHTPIESEWSAVSVINIDEVVTLSNETVYGPYYASINVSLTIEQNRAAWTSLNHAVEYQFDFGDGTISDWDASSSVIHTYTAAGIYSVIYRARCAEDTLIMSDWSTVPHDIDITDSPEVITTPVEPQKSYGNQTVGTLIHFSISGTISTFGDDIQFQVTYGDGSVSGWVAGSYTTLYGYSVGVQHTFTAAGTYNITAQARCATHPGVTSNVSPALEIIIAE